MKRKICLLLSILAIAAQAYCQESAACDLPTKNFHIRDSAKIAEDYSFYDISLYVPKKGGIVTSVVCDSIYGWICDICSSKYTKDLDAVLKDRSNAYFERYREEVKGYDTGFAWFYETDIRPVSYCSEYITMNVTGYNYLGGAHGMPFDYCVTFRTSDGHRMTWSDYTDNGEELRPLITAELDSEWFGEDEVLQPLPYNDPWIIGDTLVFRYTPYEIAPFAAGMPEAEIGYTTIEKWLKPWVVKACRKFAKENPNRDKNKE